MGVPSDDTGKNAALCHIRCSTIKIPTCSKVLGSDYASIPDYYFSIVHAKCNITILMIVYFARDSFMKNDIVKEYFAVTLT
jgi:hypothetical protein